MNRIVTIPLQVDGTLKSVGEPDQLSSGFDWYRKLKGYKGVFSMPTMTQDDIDKFLDRPLIAHVTTLRVDGSAHTVPVWYQYDNPRFYVFTPKSSVKVAHLRRDPRLTISIASEDEPYHYVVASGAAELSDSCSLERGAAIASRYRGVAGTTFVKHVDMEYGGVTILTLVPTRLMAWASD